tara:strand:- start:399 stop:2684 length:2286 start_codon:yes stop_codon:yes gene_type:complete
MTEKPNYAIMRIGKIRTRAVLDAVEWHNTRQIPAGIVEGLELPEEWTVLTGSYRDRADKILKDTGATHEQGKVLAVEVLLTASPEWWTTASKEMKRAWWKAQYAYAEHLFGPGLLAFTPHLDESTPHAQLVGLPLYHAIKKKTGPKPKDPEKLHKRLEEEAKAPKIWRLSHDAVFGGGPVGLAERQTEYHGFVAHLGLSRGKDTVGLGVKHIPLKHYANLLTQMERDLAREAEELAEQRMALEHYEKEQKESFARLAAQQNAIRQDELQLFADQENLRVREEQLASEEASLAVRQAFLKHDEDAAREAKRQLDERQTLLLESLDRQKQKERDLRTSRGRLDAREIRLDRAEASLMDRDRNVDRREQNAAAREAQNEAASDDIRLKNRDLERSLAQISILTGVMSGRLTVGWDDSAQPRITRGSLKPHETEALRVPWPPILQAPLRHAMTMANIRKALAEKLGAILTRLKARRREVSSRETAVAFMEETAQVAQAEAQRATAEAAKRTESAAQVQKTADEAIKRSQEIKAEAESARQVADARIAQSERVEESVAQKRSELADLDAGVVAKKEDLVKLGNELADEKAAITQLKRIGDAIRSEHADLIANRGALEKEVEELEIKGRRLAKERADIDTKRLKLETERARWDHSVRIWSKAAEEGASVEERDGRDVIVFTNLESGLPRVVNADDVDPSIMGLLRQRDFLVRAMEAAQQLADSLDEQKRLFAERNPHKKPEMEKERREGRKRVEDAWASIEAGGHGR